MAGVTDQLIAVPRDLAIHSAGPVALHRPANDNHRAAVCGIPILHGFEGSEDLVVMIAVFQGKHVPAIGRPLLVNLVAIIFRGNHPAHERIIDPSIVVGQQDTQAFAHLERQGLRLELLGVPLGHGKFALECQHF